MSGPSAQTFRDDLVFRVGVALSSLYLKPPGVSRAMGPAHKGVCRSVGQLFSVLTGYCPVFVSSFFSMFSFFLFFLAFLYFICYFNFSHFNYF